jgi:ParB-like chromosome segregation protein Spo0J
MAQRAQARPDMLQVERWPLDRLHVSPMNSRLHPQAQVEQIAASIGQWGFTMPVLTDDVGEIIAGEGRWKAAQLLGLKDVPVIVARGWSEAQKLAYREADNQLGENSRWDDAKRAAVLSRLVEADFDVALIGIAEDDRKSLLGESDDRLTVREIETGDVNDEFWISIRGPLKHQADALTRMRDGMRDLEGVTVELGAIAVDK